MTSMLLTRACIATVYGYGSCQCYLVQQHSQRAARLIAAAGIDISSLGIEVPEIDADLDTYQTELGAQFDANGVATSYGNSDQVLEALTTGVVIAERSHWGRIRIAGEDRLAFLHNQSTNAFKQLSPGQGCDTVFVTATARALDLATALVMQGQVLLLVSPSMRQQLLERFDKYIFPGDRVEIADVSDRCRMFSIAGPEADVILREVCGDAISIIGERRGTHQMLRFGSSGAPVIIAVGSGLTTPGYTLIPDESVAGDLYAILVNKGCVAMGTDDWERARVVQGRPAAGSELTPDYNPLEAGLAEAVSVEKGCYIGQETLSKVANAGGPKQQLWGLKLQQPAEPGTPISADGAKVGTLTSCVDLGDEGHFGLGYLRSKSKGAQVTLEGIEVMVGDAVGRVVDIPFATRSVPTKDADEASSSGATAGSFAARAEEARQQKEAAKAAEQAAKEERLKVQSGEGADAGPNKWRLVVDRKIAPFRGRRVVDVEHIQRTGRPEQQLY